MVWTGTPNVPHQPPVADQLEDLAVGFILVLGSRGIDKDELVAVFSMIQDPMRGDFGGAGF